MAQDLEGLKKWIGERETDVDYVTIPSIYRLSATLDRDDPMPKFGPVTRMLALLNSGRLSTKFGSLSRQAEKQPTPNPVRSTRFSQDAGMI